MKIIRPDDFHVHVRQGMPARQFIQYTAAQFGRATIMPNTNPPIRTVAEAERYRENCLAPLSVKTSFEPMMTLYLTDETTPEQITEAAMKPWIIGAKLYPAGATTNSADGVTNLDKSSQIYKVFAEMERMGLPLLVHAEEANGDVFKREEMFILCCLQQITNDFPLLKIVVEHITTAWAVQWVRNMAKHNRKIGATITAHHLLVDYNHMLGDGLRPHMYCKPILKSQANRMALIEAATSGDHYFFAGTDSAPHPVDSKERHCCAAGCFTALNAIELYAEAFERAGSFKNDEELTFEAFMSRNGADFFGLPLNKEDIELVKEDHQIQSNHEIIDSGMETGNFKLRPFWAGETLQWKLKR